MKLAVEQKEININGLNVFYYVEQPNGSEIVIYVALSGDVESI